MSSSDGHVAPNHRPGRKASWFELFFDLAFVASVAQLTGSLSEHYDFPYVLQFAFVLLLLWWAWLGHTFHATRFDEDRPGQHVMGLLQILAVVIIGYGASDVFGSRAVAFACGMGMFKFLLVVAYWQARSHTGARALAGRYGVIYLLQAVLWLVSTQFASPGGFGCWVAILLLDIVSPFLVARFTHELPPHPEHLPERFGLFTIILLGEGVAASLHALSHAGRLTSSSLGLAALGTLLAFLFWSGYFERARGQGERHAQDASAGRQLRPFLLR